MPALLHAFVSAAHVSAQELPLFGCPVPAGFPSPVDDLDTPFDSTRYLLRHPASMFLARVSADFMAGVGIHPGDLVAMDRALRTGDAGIMTAVATGDHTSNAYNCGLGSRVWWPKTPAVRP